MTTSFENLVNDCLYNWLGYGNLNGPIWFMGMEEGGAEIWRQRTKTMTESLSIRGSFSLSMDFQHVWENLYNIPLETFKGPNVWRYMAAFLLSLEDIEPSSENIREFVFEKKKLGKLDGNHFLCEFLPLPRQSNNSIDEYKEIWNTNSEYINELAPKRFELIKNVLTECNNVKLLVSYDKKFTDSIINNFESINVLSWENPQNKSYELKKLNISDNRILYLLKTPFFGQGQISYEGLKYAAQTIKDNKII